ncbi:NAD-dependent epimerase/dehydratase [Dillenia turbinata]|uniref:NAD-dependent epimerase/dehydratase n=1 Tax=Dillenia turbinata TaxID=194707 RepID=A0AAN8VIJ6_9MAGN
MAVSSKTDIEHVALIVGVTGLVGRELIRNLVTKSRWKIYGVARKPDLLKPIEHPNYQFISCDLLNPLDTQKKLSSLGDVTHIFWVTWSSQFQIDTKECCDQNKAMLSNALDALLPNAKALKHVSLQTGTKHYVSLQGPFDDANSRIFDENSPRVSGDYNFYYHLEDMLKERLAHKVAWSVHRPGLLLGCSQISYFNFIGCLCVYGTLCKHLNLPFLFGGTRERWEETHIDGSDGRLVAEQHIWAATNNEICSRDEQAFNATNGTSFTWKEIWPALGDKFGVAVKEEEMFSEGLLFSNEMADKGPIWQEIVAKEGLQRTEMEDLANWPFLDSLFRCPFKLLASREKADRYGFTRRYRTLDSIMYWIDVMRDEKLIP